MARPAKSPLEAHMAGAHKHHPRATCSLCNPVTAPPISDARTSWAHRGYVIRWNRSGDRWLVEKDGRFVGDATGLEDARKQIDGILDR